ncbi:hypothetical protein RRF57_013238 [Xylaria bambusicola]|uniref:Uncharacterized protein n=1 Tax=Xylaria bambusicola TaxID=326684 RepID=A0AAN7ZFD5_9PEZI
MRHPLTRGSVHITSSLLPRSSEGVSIDPNFFGHPFDLEMLARHVQLAEKVAMTKPFSGHLKLDGKRGLGMPEPGEFSDLQKAKEYLCWSASLAGVMCYDAARDRTSCRTFFVVVTYESAMQVSYQSHLARIHRE